MFVATKMPLLGFSLSYNFRTRKGYKPRVLTSYLSCSPCKTAFSFGKILDLQQPHTYSMSNFQMVMSIKSAADGSGLNPVPANNNNGGTRLTRAVQAIKIEVNAKINQFQKNLPMKLLFSLIGFYCATAFATAIGQTGDWDVLSAALAVVVVEGIGALMYRSSLTNVDNVRNLIVMCNYWKAGLSLGLFLDSFKY